MLFCVGRKWSLEAAGIVSFESIVGRLEASQDSSRGRLVQQVWQFVGRDDSMLGAPPRS